MTLSTETQTTEQHDAQGTALAWAVEKQIEANVSYMLDGRWTSLRTVFVRADAEQGVFQLAVNRTPAGDSTSQTMPAIGEQVGISFRRGHKKCLFVTPILTVQSGVGPDNAQTELLVLRTPKGMRSLQRRAYQRVVVPEGVFVAAKIWEGGVPVDGAVAWPVCSGRVANISMGGVLIETRVDQNPRLSSGEVVGVEITTRPGASLMLDGMYRHCMVDGEQRLGLGFHFPAIEHELPGRSSITDLAEFVAKVRAMQ